MPITLEKHLELLSAGEDALQALDRLWALVQREGKLAAEGGASWQQAFENVGLMGQPEFLLTHPIETKMVVAMEREYYSPTRLGINRRSKAAQARKREKNDG